MDFFGGDPINIPRKIDNERQSSFSFVAYVKCIALVFNWRKCLDQYLHLKPTTGCQISTLRYFFFGSGPFEYPMKNWQRAAMFFLIWDLSQWHCPGFYVPGWVSAHQAHSRVWNINFDMCIFLRDTINIPWKTGNGRQSSFSIVAYFKEHLATHGKVLS